MHTRVHLHTQSHTYMEAFQLTAMTGAHKLATAKAWWLSASTHRFDKNLNEAFIGW